MPKPSLFTKIAIGARQETVAHLVEIGGRLETKGAHLRILDQNMDTGTPSERLMLHVFGAVAEFEIPERPLIVPANWAPFLVERQGSSAHSARRWRRWSPPSQSEPKYRFQLTPLHQRSHKESGP